MDLLRRIAEEELLNGTLMYVRKIFGGDMNVAMYPMAFFVNLL